MSKEISRTTVQQITHLVAGPITFNAVRCVDDDGAKHAINFRMTFGGKVLAEMGEEAARLFVTQVQHTLAREYGDLTSLLPTHAAVDADRKRVAAARSTA